jgi:LAS superfamily LD-carboxypeptidase LdcB
MKQSDDISSESDAMVTEIEPDQQDSDLEEPASQDEIVNNEEGSDHEPDLNEEISEPTEPGFEDQALAVDNGEEEQTAQVVEDGNYLLALITKETTLKSDYAPSDLQPIPSSMNPYYDMQLRKEALENLKYLFFWADKEGVTLSIRSAYRSYATQKGLFEDYASRYGPEEANRFSAKPGQSEHQLGTTVDFGGTTTDFTAEFANTDQGQWLAANAHRFGFAMSYPEGMEGVTGYIFEPWHYRYIGIKEALKWKMSGMPLNKYLEIQPQEFDL